MRLKVLAQKVEPEKKKKTTHKHTTKVSVAPPSVRISALFSCKNRCTFCPNVLKYRNSGIINCSKGYHRKQHRRLIVCSAQPV